MGLGCDRGGEADHGSGVSLQIRPKTYRGEVGFILTGQPRGQVGGWPIGVWTHTRTEAEWIREKINRGEVWEFSKDEQLALPQTGGN